MKALRFFFVLAWVWTAWVVGAAASPLAVSDGRAAQRAGTRLVDIYYDISGGTPPYTVSLQGSQDGGTTWTLPLMSVSGDVGAGVIAGTNHRVTWDAGTDWAGQVSTNVKFRVTAVSTQPVTDGFALIPAGSFQMGDQSSPQIGYSNELPVHTVQVSAFYMGKYLVTKEVWDTVRAWALPHGYTDLAAGNGSYASKGEYHPVHSISWYDTVKWCNARSEKEGLTACYTVSGVIYRTGSSDAVTCNWNANGYRLPSEAEWEKAARGGRVGQNFPWGNTISQSQADYCVYSGNGTTNYYSYDVTPRPGYTTNFYYHPTYTTGVQPYTSPVGSFAANGYGLYDMAGNVYEWCWDWSSGYTAGAQTDPRGSASGLCRVGRGGSWSDFAYSCRVAYRLNYYAPSVSVYNFGFRVARTTVP